MMKGFYLASFARWQMISTEKLKASAKATDSHNNRSTNADFNSITKQNTLVTTVRAFFSDRYFFIL